MDRWKGSVVADSSGVRIIHGISAAEVVYVQNYLLLLFEK